MSRRYRLLQPYADTYMEVDLPTGATVVRYDGYTYGLEAPNCVTCTVGPTDLDHPFFQVPRNILEELPDEADAATND
jgi:hypothetical protein